MLARHLNLTQTKNFFDTPYKPAAVYIFGSPYTKEVNLARLNLFLQHNRKKDRQVGLKNSEENNN